MIELDRETEPSSIRRRAHRLRHEISGLSQRGISEEVEVLRDPEVRPVDATSAVPPRNTMSFEISAMAART
jgi:hypothetical protein